MVKLLVTHKKRKNNMDNSKLALIYLLKYIVLFALVFFFLICICSFIFIGPFMKTDEVCFEFDRMNKKLKNIIDL